jgi:hypothetical protein
MKKAISLLFLIVCFSYCKMGIDNAGGYILSESTEYGNELNLSYADTSVFYQWKDGTRSLQKGVFFKYIFKNKIDTLFIWEGSTVIEAHINDFKYNSSFIIVDQKPLDSIWGPMINVNNTPKREKQFDNANKAILSFENSNVHTFWIINKVSKEVYGPMQKYEYLKKRKELMIPEELVLKEE